MASVFMSCDTKVYKLSVPGCNVFEIKVDGNTFVAPITGFALEMQGNYQFLHTVNDFIYLYTFGDRIGDLVLTGMCFQEPACSGEFVSSNRGDAYSVFNFYKNNRIAKRPDPVSVILGTVGNFKAFLTGTKMEQAKPDNGIIQWVMRFNTLMPT